MADISVTAAKVQAVGTCGIIRSKMAGATITRGQTVYETTAGLVGLCDANDSGKEQFYGVALQDVSSGQAVDCLVEGLITGYDLRGLDVGALVYQSDTAGAAATAASGTKTVVIGKVTALSDNATTPTKVREVRRTVTSTW